MDKTIGVCLGAWSVSFAHVAQKNGKIIIEKTEKIVHNGNPKSIFYNYLIDNNLISIPIVVTGRKFRNIINITSISEAEASEYALNYVISKNRKHSKSKNTQYTALASLGAETFLVYNLDKSNHITSVVSKNKCASGTGEFFLQQIKRMDLNIDEAMEIAKNAEPYKVSGRCSVFCKSDCTHALNKGIEKSQVTAGLAKMIAEKIDELIREKGTGKILLVGGVTKNKVVMNFVKQSNPNVCVPEEAEYFEAIGAALYAIYSPHNNHISGISKHDLQHLFKNTHSSFSFQKPLNQFIDKVVFKQNSRRKAEQNEESILGLDVGSTTTKAVVIAKSDYAILASSYLYTNGNPIKAAKECYKEILEFFKNEQVSVNIVGLGTTGSGRQIAGLHAQTEGVYNEITAHSTAAVFYDSEVDTIFEIGGQDAKYSYIVNKVPADYAMNEACSAGTGSFIEEAAFESLGIKVTEIEALALASTNPPNFSDQCAAFISSDIKTAQQEGIDKNDIIAGLTYSICYNYLNRVKGNRPVGKKIFMQGGVCYNKAIPIAMAAIANTEIIVPPDPGLMGALGVALEVIEKQKLGFLDTSEFDLEKLIDREVVHHKGFICQGGREKCDLKCNISVIGIGGKKFPFGGACEKYNTINHSIISNRNNAEDKITIEKNDFEDDNFIISDDSETSTYSKDKYDLIKKRNELMFNKYAFDRFSLSDKSNLKTNVKKIGINSSFYTQNLFPLYYNFFAELGFEVVLPDKVDETGLNHEMSQFCYPMQLSLCLFKNLLEKNTDFIFSPAIFEIDAEKQETQRLDFNCACAFVTGEPYILKQAFKEFEFDLKNKMITPSLNFSNGLDKEEKNFIKIAKQIGVQDEIKIKQAYQKAIFIQLEFQNELYQIGSDFIANLKNYPDDIAIILLGRSYNSFVDFANKGIPRKFASRSIHIIPFDMIDVRDKAHIARMYWETGNRILKVTEIIKNNPQLFATYITNFSCAPDSMILNTFRRIMGAKPSLTLELDSHSADAGINTRIDAFIDILQNYLKISNNSIKNNDINQFSNDISCISHDNILKNNELVVNKQSLLENDFKKATIEFTEPIATYISSDGERISLADERVLVLIPAMNDLANELFASAFKSCGINSKALNVHSNDALRFGRANASGKECLPIILMAGNLLHYMDTEWDGKTHLVYFQVQGAGNCRLGQYPVFLEQMIEDRKLRNVAQLVLMNEDGFAGLGSDCSLRAVQAIMASDVLEDIRSGIMAYAVDKVKGIEIFNREFTRLSKRFTAKPKDIYSHLENFSNTISQEVPATAKCKDFKSIAMIGEIFCRKDLFAHKWLNEYFAKAGFVLKIAYISEWIAYIDYLISIDLLESDKSLSKKFERMLRNFFMKDAEKKIKKALSKSGYYEFERMNVEPALSHSKHIVPLEYKGEPGLTLGIALNDSFEKYCGIINFGPFGCMPTRFSEAVSVPEMKIKNKIIAKKLNNPKYQIDSKFDPETEIPFLTIESDGNPYSQLIEARLETFIMQANRAWEIMQK